MSVQDQPFEQTALRPSHAAGRLKAAVSGSFDVVRFVENFTTFVEPIGSVSELRRLVLTLALQGRLSRYDARDTSAADALKKVAADRRWRIEERPSKPKLDPKIEALAGVTPVPKAWEECRLNDVAQLINGRAYAQPELLSAGTPVIRIQNLNGGNEWYYSDLALPERQYCDTGDLLFAWSASFGPYIWTRGKAIYHYHIWKLNLSEAVDKRFLYFSLLHITDVVREQSHGLAMLHMTKGQMERWPILLPPLDEQKRIVAKVDQLMTLCDGLEACQTRQREFGARLTKAALMALSNAEGPAEFAAAWGRVAENFNVLMDHSDRVDDLRAAILQLGFRGGLCPPGKREAALAELCTQRAREEVPADKRPCELPNHWAWLYLDQVVGSVTDGDHQAPPKAPTGVPFLTIGNVSGGRLDFRHTRFVPHEYFKGLDSRRVPAKGDILYTVVGATYGRPVRVDEDRPFCVQRHIAIIRPDGSCDATYLYWFLRSPLAYEQATAATTGTAQPTVPLRPLRRFKVPLPPRQEQLRIVGKIESLMALCDDLEAKLSQREGSAAKLRDCLARTLVG